MNFIQAIQSGFRRYADFSGRSSRSEYWYWVLFGSLVSLVISVLNEAIIGRFEELHIVLFASFVSLLLSLVLTLTTIAVSARRLHDIDRTGWCSCFFLFRWSA